MKTIKTTITFSLVLTLLMATTALAQETERTITVSEGTRLEVANHAGEVTIRGWDKDEVQFLAEHGSRDEVEVVDDDRRPLPGEAARKGARLADRISRASVPTMREFRQVGLMIGIELRTRVRPYLQQLQDRGVLALAAGSRVLRLLPPLVISDGELDRLGEVLVEVLQ